MSAPPASPAHWLAHPPVAFVLAAGMIVGGAAVLLLMGHTVVCTCGTVKLWHGDIFSSDSSQHLTDWYTPSHVIHGILFYAGIWLVARRLPLSTRLLIALAIEVGWEVLENTPWIIGRYRETTISLDYFGDSVVNSVADILAMLLGFYLAVRLPVWVNVVLVVAMELIVGWYVRDNLALNIIMLLWPLDSIRAWQSGG